MHELDGTIRLSRFFTSRLFAFSFAFALLIPMTAAAAQGPADAFGALFHAVQENRVFPDSKTFADAVPVAPAAEIMRRFELERPESVAALRAFVVRYFRLPDDPATPGLRAHIQALW